jgi:hypothetical protein
MSSLIFDFEESGAAPFGISPQKAGLMLLRELRSKLLLTIDVDSDGVKK